MPYINQTSYRAPLLLRYHHFNTMLRPAIHRVPGVQYQRERIFTPDDDFLDLDWSIVGGDRLVVMLHGLEGSSDSTYVKSLVRLSNREGWDGLAINFRSCSGEMNRHLHSYHSGDTSDLDLVLQHVLSKGRYREICIAGFSLGGNVTLKFTGEKGSAIYPEVKKVVAVSVPIHLESSSYELGKWHNRIYMGRFMNSLKSKVQQKLALIGDHIDLEAVMASRTFGDFDEHFTAPVNGFKNAIDYWTQSSSLQFIPSISVPTLLINARDDSFLSDRCYPVELAEQHPFFHFEAPQHGGHVGFVLLRNDNFMWIEKRIVQFLKS
ncbi:MAG: alpha/beta fold hydrolase [Bacteroidota bacterium]